MSVVEQQPTFEQIQLFRKIVKSLNVKLPTTAELKQDVDIQLRRAMNGEPFEFGVYARFMMWYFDDVLIMGDVPDLEKEVVPEDIAKAYCIQRYGDFFIESIERVEEDELWAE